jgi:exopolysaccharide biosynthesis polyprenyl glycosylphosphotransferase
MRSFWRSPFLTLFLLVVDAIATVSLWSAVYHLRHFLDRWFANPINAWAPYGEIMPLLLILTLGILARFGFYSHHERIASLNRIMAILWACFWVVIVVILWDAAFNAQIGRAIVVGYAAAMGGYLWGTRTVFRIVKQNAVQSGRGLVRVLVIGAGDLGRETVQRIYDHPDIGFKIVGYVKAHPTEEMQEVDHCPILGTIEDLNSILQRRNIEEVFIAIPDMKENDLFGLVESIQKNTQVVCKVVANLLYVIANRSKVDEVTDLPVIAFASNVLTPAEVLIKRGVDLVVGLAFAIVLALPTLLFAILIRRDSPGSVLFTHERVGYKGRVFKMYKFRTMRTDANPYEEAPVGQDDPRVTRVGHFLRRTSLDEIPQIWNVIRGDMSIVGPRPEMQFIVDSYLPWQSIRLQAKPGLTGLWQVAGRKNLPLHFNLEYDYFYVKNQSLALDLEILVRTIPAVLLGRGAY